MRHVLPFGGSGIRPILKVLRRAPPEPLNEEFRELLHVLNETVTTLTRENTLAFPFRFPAPVLWKKGMCNAVAKFIERWEIRRHPLRYVMDTPDKVELLKQIQLLQDKVVKGLETLRLPKIWEASLLSKIMPTDDRTEELVHQDILQNDSAASQLILRKFQESRPSLGIGFSHNLAVIKS